MPPRHKVCAFAGTKASEFIKQSTGKDHRMAALAPVNGNYQQRPPDSELLLQLAHDIGRNQRVIDQTEQNPLKLVRFHCLQPRQK